MFTPANNLDLANDEYFTQITKKIQKKTPFKSKNNTQTAKQRSGFEERIARVPIHIIEYKSHYFE